MPSKILLADDSMTAQKMGKEILTSAGYEVTAVSNGAAAAKKLGEKYAVIILDINMPGYTGFELCEKIRANMDSAKTPVLLTSGKMEHYEPKDVQRVKADGVIIKPFEATDLLATVQKLIEKSAVVTRDYEKTVTMQRPKIEEFKDQSYNDWKEAEEPEPVKKAMEMSSAAASAPAFGMDMDEHIEPAAVIPPPPVAATPPPPPPAPAFEAAAPAFEMTAPLTSVESSNIESLLQTPPPPMMMEEAPAPSIPIAPPTFSTSPGRDPMFEAPSNESDAPLPKDPALAAREEMTNEEFLAKSSAEPTPVAPEATANADAEFEARVAAAMSTGYEDAHEMVEPEPEEVHAEPVQEIQQTAPVMEAAPVMSEPEVAAEPSRAMPGMMAEPPEYERTVKMQRPVELETSEPTPADPNVEIAQDPMIERSYESTPEVAPVVEAPPVADAILVEQLHAAVQDMPVESHVEEPAPTMVAEVAPPPPSPAPTTGQDLELASALAAAVGGEVPTAMAAAASASSPRNTSSVDHNLIAAAVHRAMTKMMPAIMTEVAKELDPEKK